ncbi:D-serine ammonia-lyase [Natronincola peptidivorans]|uniref:Probable D-serine dehydratase n=1 Tax=Natronincola peptidivorans TaxID=426128 RepID=A0A1I0GJR4_9FIRM|nr:D-serine ammonia-lyase [Natronincola peptidivorans]SET71447.1 D-serine ammonia-lyase [Natronincola peptidivorans]
MEPSIVQGEKLDIWQQRFPLLNKIMATEEVLWINPKNKSYDEAMKKIHITEEEVMEAEARLYRFAPYLAKVFPETIKSKGIIESPLVEISNMKKYMEKSCNINITDKLLLKCDDQLPIAGSIKARGGIYEVLKHAEALATESKLLTKQDDYSILASERYKVFFSDYSIAVGSTGNLGLSIGIISAKIGFKVTVHMSADAKQWKKDLLRSKGVKVVEYTSDYSKAVEEGRKQSEKDLKTHFIDDENSKNLFLGYAVAAYRLKKQLEEMKIKVDENHPLYVYLPCGVGGGPGGVAFGLKLLYRDDVHCYFAEPTHSPCMLIGMMTGLHNKISVQDFGIDNITEADGLAVGRASGFVGKTLEELLSGVFTVEDDKLYILLKKLVDLENIHLEPSALAGMQGPVVLAKNHRIEDFHNKNATHIVWATGGSLVPEEVMKNYYEKGAYLLQKRVTDR